ncbi:hypothetical protein FJTKL_12078 [Diaporthe vaccinii]|uniref:Uncharacterized protein n=1 Tax=Diaporthe vaccinii TaxID=105482 RepID=A0ABR4FB57_9PEZI
MVGYLGTYGSYVPVCKAQWSPWRRLLAPTADGAGDEQTAHNSRLVLTAQDSNPITFFCDQSPNQPNSRFYPPDVALTSAIASQSSFTIHYTFTFGFA